MIAEPSPHGEDTLSLLMDEVRSRLTTLDETRTALAELDEEVREAEKELKRLQRRHRILLIELAGQ